ncbi:MAG: class I SAM-dependent methyltransferase [Bacteroidetes bacterium]|nr:class I SAM-dependent methyltransferase [Bacteroidota bacterium]
MNIAVLKEHIKDVDIYILDQILKDCYQPGAKILDVGCGNGRNLKWFYQPDYEIYGTDTNTERLNSCKELYKLQKENFTEASIVDMPFETNTFDHVICIAVLHFANDLNQYLKMFEELLRILKPQGSLLIRTATNIGIENQVQEMSNGVFNLPDGSTRFLLTPAILHTLESDNRFKWIENVKTTIVKDKRAMTTLVLQKQS